MITETARQNFLADETRKKETIDFFNTSINYREGQPKAVEVIDSSNTSVKFRLDNGGFTWREWW